MIKNLNSCWRADDREAIEILSNYQSWLETIRQDYEPLWQDVVDYLAFNRFNFLQNQQKGKKANTLVFDGSPVVAWKLLVSGIQGNTISQVQRWFSLTIPNTITFPRTSQLRKYSGRLDEIPWVKVWLEDKEDQMYNAFNRSNFYSEATTMIADVSSIGTATIHVEEDTARQRINFLTLNPGECYAAENRFGEVDTMFRKFSLNARQASELFKRELMDPGLQHAIDNAPLADYNFIHATFPRDDVEMYFGNDGKWKPKAGPNNKPWVSMYIQGGNTAMSSSQTPATGGVGTSILKKSGFRFNPFICWRWFVNSEETYGRSPAMDAIVDILKLNTLGRTMLYVAQTEAEPPMLVHEVFRDRLRLNPRAINYFSNKHAADELVKPIQKNINFQVGVEREERIKKIIDQHFMTDFFVMLYKAAMEGSRLSVPQVLEMQGEKAAQLMPMLERMIPDFLNPVVNTVDQIETDANRMPPMPDILFEVAHQVKTEYNGTLAVAQRRWAKAQGVMQGMEMLKPLLEMYPEARDVIDADATAMELLKVTNYPAKGIRTMDEIAKIRQQRAEMQQKAEQEKKQQTMIQMAPALSKMAAKGGALDNLHDKPDMAQGLAQGAAKVAGGQ